MRPPHRMESKEFRLALAPVVLNVWSAFVVRIAEVFLAVQFLSRQQLMMRCRMMSLARRRATSRCLTALRRRASASVN